MTNLGDLTDRIEKILLEEGAAPGNSIHGWRCEYPDRYGACTCVRDTAAHIAAAVAAVWPAPAIPKLEAD
jgi:hypothetical protein